MALLPGYILAGLSSHGVAFFSGNIPTDFPWDFMAGFLGFIPTSFVRNLMLNNLWKIWTIHLVDTRAFHIILGVALPFQLINGLLAGDFPALDSVVDLLAHLLGDRVALLL